MAKKKKIQETTIEDFYDLKVDKIDELVAALKGDETAEYDPISMNIADCTGVDSPENTNRRGKQKTFDPYKVDKFSHIPAWVKAIFIKWWFAGCVCWFVMSGIMNMNDLDKMILCGAVLGLIVDVLVNPLFRYMESDSREYNNYMMFPFPFKAFWTFFTNIIYYIIVVIGVSQCYTGISLLFGIKSSWLEPLMFGIFAVIVDMVFIGLKDAVVYIVKKLKKRKREGVVNV